MTNYYFNAFDEEATAKLSNQINDTLKTQRLSKREIVILCIGTDRATGDCLGPLVGEHLKEMLPTLSVYGTLEAPIHALNLEETIEGIQTSHKNPFIIAIDASLGVSDHIGFVTLSHAPLHPGKGVNKKLPAIGNLSITGIVNVAGFPSSILLQSTRLYTVMALANCISNAIATSSIGNNDTFCAKAI